MGWTSKPPPPGIETLWKYILRTEGVDFVLGEQAVVNYAITMARKESLESLRVTQAAEAARAAEAADQASDAPNQASRESSSKSPAESSASKSPARAPAVSPDPRGKAVNGVLPYGAKASAIRIFSCHRDTVTAV
ncbi:hypothetical protein PC116_g26944 [Phytophthora cactorum]|uniref:Uncharacterized protein n=1 Tax=Phytophthora cactorum TaxID=29920 RepID=A0A329RA40_9STRA|nr:hypothetical protein PC112_g22700 [Phytophthora cactorum]KAG2876047.1 hypothetical protein PC114_g24393 [Phytophthora cactorum]KAG2887872.1 hypothetical protein PC117_g25060 [Phytophthora cactorum]KAG2905871.1 hypothetical protein PC115_g14484 [Phytophthora cactorum]KAG3072837.1 hypothetical protein PC122_g15082 [Phytophthora cactorum]